MNKLDFPEHKGFEIEAMLLRWANSSSGGPQVVLQLRGEEDLEPFKSMTLAKGKIAGQRLQLVVVEIGEDEKPKEKPKGGALSILAARWCQDEAFQFWLAAEFSHSWADNFSTGTPTHDRAAAVLRKICNVSSRAELDHDAVAAHTFDTVIRRPYMHHLGEQ